MFTKGSDSSIEKYRLAEEALKTTIRRWKKVSEAHKDYIDPEFHYFELTAGSGVDDHNNPCMFRRFIKIWKDKFMKPSRRMDIFGETPVTWEPHFGKLEAVAFEVNPIHWWLLNDHIMKDINSMEYPEMTNFFHQNVKVLNQDNKKLEDMYVMNKGVTEEGRKNKLGLAVSDGYGTSDFPYEPIKFFAKHFYMLDQLILFPIRQTKRNKGRTDTKKFPMLDQFIEEMRKIRQVKEGSRRAFFQVSEPFNSKQDYIWVFSTRDRNFPRIEGFLHETRSWNFNTIIKEASHVRRKEITDHQG